MDLKLFVFFLVALGKIVQGNPSRISLLEKDDQDEYPYGEGSDDDSQDGEDTGEQHGSESELWEKMYQLLFGIDRRLTIVEKHLQPIHKQFIRRQENKKKRMAKKGGNKGGVVH